MTERGEPGGPGEPAPDLLLRLATEADAAAAGATYTASRAVAARQGHMPAALHSAEDDVRHFGGLIADPGRETWVAERDERVVGFVVLTPTWVEHLFVHPDHQGEGIGTALLDLVRSLRPGGFGLYVFETNQPARALYERAGLVVTARSDGSQNEERAPDLMMEWANCRT